MPKPATDVDLIDLRILEAVQTDADRSADALGEQVHLSLSAVQRRLARLKKAGIIERTTAVVSPKAVDQDFTVLVEIELETELLTTVEPFRRWVRSEKSIQSCWYVTGECDYMLVVMVRDLPAYVDFTERLMGARVGVRRYRSLVSMLTIKRTLDINFDDIIPEQ